VVGDLREGRERPDAGVATSDDAEVQRGDGQSGDGSGEHVRPTGEGGGEDHSPSHGEAGMSDGA
jgi:hypothetical protein